MTFKSSITFFLKLKGVLWLLWKPVWCKITNVSFGGKGFRPLSSTVCSVAEGVKILLYYHGSDWRMEFRGVFMISRWRSGIKRTVCPLKALLRRSLWFWSHSRVRNSLVWLQIPRDDKTSSLQRKHPAGNIPDQNVFHSFREFISISLHLHVLCIQKKQQLFICFYLPGFCES